MWEVFNMGCGFVATVPEDRAQEAADILAARHPGARRIGTVTDRAGRDDRPRRRRAARLTRARDLGAVVQAPGYPSSDVGEPAPAAELRAHGAPPTGSATWARRIGRSRHESPRRPHNTAA